MSLLYFVYIICWDSFTIGKDLFIHFSRSIYEWDLVMASIGMTLGVTCEFLVTSIILIVLLLFITLLYTFRSNSKLQNAQNLLRKSVEEMNDTNIQLVKVQEELIIALQKAKESDRLKSSFLANISHEIRTPLNAILGFSTVVGEAESKRERQEYMDLIRKNSDLLLQLFGDILDLSKIEAGVLEFYFSEINAFNLCSNVIASLQFKCKPDVHLFLDHSVVAVSLYTDTNRVMQVLFNLVNNAIKFTVKGSIKVGYLLCEEETWIEFYVLDTGIGISKEKQALIFERFTKLDPFVEGAGLGLSISQMIVRLLGGEIGMESEENVGSRFWFRIRKNQMKY